MRRPYVLKYLQIIFLIILGSVNFLNALKTGSFIDWLIYAACMIGVIVVAFSIKALRDKDKITRDSIDKKGASKNKKK